MQNETASSEAPKSRPAKETRTGKLMPFLVTVFTILVFVGAIVFMAEQVRSSLHEGILREDGEVLRSAIRLEEKNGEAVDSQQERVFRVSKAADFRDDEVWGVRIFDEDGKFLIAFPGKLKPRDLDPEDAKRVKRGEVLGKLEPIVEFDSEYIHSSAEGQEHEPMRLDGKLEGPVLRSIVPIEGGAAQFLLKGDRVQGKLWAIDDDVRRYSMGLGVVGSVVIGVALAWAFWRLKHANTLLQKRTGDLLRANHELTLAAKTSAVGAVAAHLIHGLKNPLFGLQMFVSHKMENNDEGTQLEWRAAADAAHRMQMMIADIVRILREDTGEQYEISVNEIVGILEGKIAAMAKEKSVQFLAKAKCSGKLANREANLVILALTNLIQNAIQASKTESKVTLEVYRNADVFSFDVSDEAGGIPKKMREKLFTPCASTKPGGTGLGLAITKQLANHMGGQLEMVRTNEVGTTFRLSIPQALFQAPSDNEAKLTSAVA